MHSENCPCPDCEPATLEDMYGCDPWDDEHFGRHTASKDTAEKARRTKRTRAKEARRHGVKATLRCCCCGERYDAAPWPTSRCPGCVE